MARLRRSGLRDPRVVLVALLILAVGGLAELGAHWLSGGPREVLLEAGYVIIGTVTVAFVYDLLLRRQHDDDIIRLVEQGLVRGATDLGLVGARPRLTFPDLFERLENNDELLWLDTYCPDQANFQQYMLVALARGARVKMLAVRPESAVSRMRAREIEKKFAYSEPRFVSEAQGQLERIHEVLGDVKEHVRKRLELRLYDDLPCAPFYIRLRDSQPIEGYSSYFLGAPTFQEPHFVWGPGANGFLWRFDQYFWAKWKRHEDDEVCFCSVQPSLHCKSSHTDEQSVQPAATDSRPS